MLPAALDVGRQRNGSVGDGAWCWSDECYDRPTPGRARGRLGLCEECEPRIRPRS